MKSRTFGDTCGADHLIRLNRDANELAFSFCINDMFYDALMSDNVKALNLKGWIPGNLINTCF